MARPLPMPPAGFDELPVEDKVDYVESLWDRVAASPDSLPVPEWHRDILDKRVRDYEADPDRGESWESVRDRLQAKLARDPQSP